MKHNVDLTLNRKFTSTTPNNRLTILRQTFKRFPWKKVESTNLIIGLLNTGSKIDRSYKQQHELKWCDRCGLDYGLKPWRHYRGTCLCKDCFDTLEYTIERRKTNSLWLNNLKKVNKLRI